ncbi:MAG: hypothetical protein R3F19_35235 [Verrucomicrobiales bacterium]
MVKFEYLYRGLCGMANAPRASSMAGHLGAAVVAGYLFGEDHPDLDGKVFAGIERDLDRITGGEESIWFDPKKAGITAEELFKPVPEADSQASLIDGIAVALDANIGATRQSGHNVIFASIAMRALKEHEQYASPSLVAGIEKLVASFNDQHAGRGYYGKQRGWLIGKQAPLADAESVPHYDSIAAMAEVVIDQLIAKASEHRQGFGGFFHLINHAAALTELDRLGYAELAKKGLMAHRHHLLLYCALPDLEAELGRLESSSIDPFEPDYWQLTKSKQWGAWLTHRIKTLYGFHTLLRFIDDEEKRGRALVQFRYLMA